MQFEERLIEQNIPFSNLEDAPIPVHVVATNLGGATPIGTFREAWKTAGRARAAGVCQLQHLRTRRSGLKRAVYTT
jgi:hypothetical protein